MFEAIASDGWMQQISGWFRRKRYFLASEIRIQAPELRRIVTCTADCGLCLLVPLRAWDAAARGMDGKARRGIGDATAHWPQPTNLPRCSDRISRALAHSSACRLRVSP